ncbi:MAG TPA: tRNA 2-thiouridine(34) synthase MnmA [Ignavibacteria bacterium]|nr:tRNA 2-thiouridine(34) synthase MnmA [Ignavibacteria bacterium]
MKIAVLLSGGVDSSVALNLLKNEGHDITAYYLKIWLQDEFSFLGDCPWEEDLEYARGVCDRADVPLEIISLQNEYWDNVVTYTISEIKEGRTPNPDIYCNSLIKFGQFYDKIDDSFEKVASGHYAKVEPVNGKYLLKRSPDPIKDQTYFLAYLNQRQLSRALFPLGDYKKSEVRNFAEQFNLPNKNRKDSQGICFLGQVKFNEFIKQHLGVVKGDIVVFETGEKIGEHEGYYYFTIGQRSGLKLGGGPWYVVKKDPSQNIVYISKENKSERSRNTFNVAKFNWIIGENPVKKNLQVKIRHGQRFFNCTLNFLDDKTAEVVLDEPDQGIAPGQFAVFYDNKICLGGSVIME